TMKVAPRASPSLRATTLPPWSSTRCFTSARPSPRPACVRVLELSAWRNRSKITGRTPGAIPCPVSLTTISTWRVDPLQVYLDPPALRRELHGVDEQVPHDLLQAVGVPRDRARAGIEHALDPDALGLGGRSHGVERRLDHGREVDLADVQA